MSQPVSPVVRELEISDGEHRWLARWLSDLDDAIVSPVFSAAEADLLPRVQRALEPWLAVASSAAFRLHLDPGGAALGAVIDPATRTLWLGSPRFTLEGHLSDMLPGCAAAPFAAAWLAADPNATPRDIDVVTAMSGLANLHRPSATLAAELATIHGLTAELGAELHTAMAAHRPGLLERFSQWGLGLQADFPVLRVHALRFVALLPSLDHDHDGGTVARLLAEMLRRTQADSRRARQGSGHRPLPWWLAAGFGVARAVTTALPSVTTAWLTRTAVRRLAGIFIAGETIEAAADTLAALRASNRSATVDQLGELVVSETEADTYRDEVLKLVAGVAKQNGGARNVADLPLAHVSVKVSALCAHYDADAVDGTWRLVGQRLIAIFTSAQEHGVFVNIDAEHYAARDLTLEMLRRALRSSVALWTWPDVGIVVQAYLRDAATHMNDVLQLATDRGVRMPVRLVKGAYWDAETTEADAHGYDAPQWLNKAETDLCFQQLCLEVLRNGDRAQLCIGSHNLRDHCFARAARTTCYPTAPVIEHQALHATYEALSTGMARMGWAVRNYIPVGSLLVGMAYLVRRVMENSSQVGVLTMARGDFTLAETLRTPANNLDEQFSSGSRLLHNTQRGIGSSGAFRCLAPARLYRPHHRATFQAAIERRAELASTPAPRPWRSGALIESRNPSDLSQVVGSVRGCAVADVAPAVTRAVAATTAWRDLGAGGRSALLLRAGERLAARRDDFAVLVASEAGKSRREALADVDEAVDFLRFYSAEAWSRDQAQPGRRGRGAIVVVAPWNFPLAIPCGMTTAALAAGNTALIKSAKQTPLVVEAFVDLLHEVGVPTDVVQHLPGDGSTVGAALVAHPDVAGCVFTGSKAVGSQLHSQLAAASHVVKRPTGDALCGKMVITEMGGKNAVIITDNADIDQAIAATLEAAFSHAGQKCSAASRLLIDARVFERFTTRFAKAAADLVLGDALAAGVQVNAVINAREQARLCAAQEAAAQECTAVGGTVLLAGGAGPGPGASVRPAVFQLPASAALAPTSLCRRELFGPVIHALPYQTLDEAVRLFNGTEYALTGGVFAQSDDDIDALLPRLRCGNLYINRSNTGARVAIESFGGFAMSGTGPKAGGRDYLEAFLAPVSEAEAMAVASTLSHNATAGNAAADNPMTGGATGAVPCLAADVAVPAWPLATADTPAASAWARQLAIGLCEARPAGDAIAIALRRLAAALPGLTAVRGTPEVTVAIPGQETHERRDLARGQTVILGARSRPGATGLMHLVAALGAGAPVLVVTAVEDGHATAPGWHAVFECLRAAGVPQNRCALAVSKNNEDAVAWALLPALATLVIDGPRTPWSAALTDALTRRRESALCLPHIWCALDGPDLRAAEGLLRRHLLVRTVAVNTMRHGAPLALGDGGGASLT